HRFGGGHGHDEVQIGVGQLRYFGAGRAVAAAVGGIGSAGFAVQVLSVGEGQRQRRASLLPPEKLGVRHVLPRHGLAQ
nr:hypothetical protein [Tanacetum cinerariifolium]